MKIELETVVYIAAVSFLVCLGCIVHYYEIGVRKGRCIEMCRPAQLDCSQCVPGGCLCIGSDKALRLKKIP